MFWFLILFFFVHDACDPGSKSVGKVKHNKILKKLNLKNNTLDPASPDIQEFLFVRSLLSPRNSLDIVKSPEGSPCLLHDYNSFFLAKNMRIRQVNNK